jgi:hypothetical protein
LCDLEQILRVKHAPCPRFVKDKIASVIGATVERFQLAQPRNEQLENLIRARPEFALTIHWD